MNFSNNIIQDQIAYIKTYIEIRTNQIIQTWNYWLEHCVKYILFVNAGGIITILSFMRALNYVRAISLPGLALGFYIVGLFLVGVIFLYMFFRFKKDYDEFTVDTESLKTDLIKNPKVAEERWQQFLAKDEPRKKFRKTALYLGLSSASCFFIGTIIGIISFFIYHC